MRPDRERGAALVESLLVALGVLLPLLTTLTGLARVQQAAQAAATAAREAVRAATTAPRLADWRAEAGAAAREAVASQGLEAPAVQADLVDAGPDAGDGRGAFVAVSVSVDVGVLGPPIDAPAMTVTAHGNGRIDPYRARCTHSPCR